MVQLPQLPAGRRTLLHLEGCDYHATVWVNGVRAGEHVGGYARFSLDITPWLHVGDNVLAVMAEDSLDPRQPRGKQRWKGENSFAGTCRPPAFGKPCDGKRAEKLSGAP